MKILQDIRSLLCICVLLSVCTAVRAQPDASPAGEEATAAPAVREVVPSIIYTMDEAGNPVAWVDSLPLEKIDELDQLEKQNRPKFLIRELRLDAVAKSNHAELKGVMKLRLLESGMHVIPIRMGAMFFVDTPTAVDHEVFVQPNRDSTGYELLVKGEADDELSIGFSSLVPLRRVGQETKFRLSVPRVAVSSFTIQIPDPVVEVTAEGDVFVSRITPEPDESSAVRPNDEKGDVADAADVTDAADAAESEATSSVDDDTEAESTTAEAPASETAASEATSDELEESSIPQFATFRVSSLQPELVLSWRPKVAPEKLSFEVRGEVEVQIDPLGIITCDAMLTMNSFNEPIERVVVQLPGNTRWSDDELSFGGYRVTPLDTVGDRQRLQIEFDEPEAKPPVVRIRVKSEQELSEFAPNFTVEQASSQRGNVSVFSDERLLDWVEGEFVRRVANLNPGRRAVVTLEYSRPDRLFLSISRQATELIVEPIFHVTLDERRATLTATYLCTKRSGNPSGLTIDLGPWTALGLGPDPDAVVGDFEIQNGVSGKLTIPLKITPDRFEVSIVATLPLSEGLVTVGGLKQVDESVQIPATNLLFEFPRLVDLEKLSYLHSTVTVSTPAEIVAEQGDSEYAEVGIPERLRSDLELDDNPSCFRMRSIGPPEPFSVSAYKLERTTEVDCEIEVVDINATQIRLRERMQWRISDVPLQNALLWMKDSVYRDGDLQVEVNGESKIDQLSLVPSFADSETGIVTVRIPLPPDLGRFDMVVTWNWQDRDDLGTATDLRDFDTLDVDLVLPKPSPSTPAQNMQVFPRLRKPLVAGYDVLISNTRNSEMRWPWVASTDIPNPDPDIEAFVDPEFPTTPMVLPLTIRRVEQDVEPTDFEELVDRAWFQTWYTDSTRTDRAVFRIISGGKLLRIQMPATTDFRKLNAFVNGRLTEFRRDGTSTIELDVDPNLESRVVELQYSLDSREPPGVLETEVPSIEGAEILGQWYWHVVMPRNECMISWPRNLTRAHEWDWSVIIPRRRPELTLKELEDWNGATRTGGQVLAGSSEYLFGAMGQADRLSVRTTLLPVYLLVVAGSILVFGLLSIYSSRRMLVVLCFGGLVGGLVFVHPAYASIAGQIGVFGVALAITAGFLRWLMRQVGARPVSRAVIAAKGTSVLRGSSSMVASDGKTTMAVGSSRLRRVQS